MHEGRLDREWLRRPCFHVSTGRYRSLYCGLAVPASQGLPFPESRVPVVTKTGDGSDLRREFRLIIVSPFQGLRCVAQFPRGYALRAHPGLSYVAPPVLSPEKPRTPFFPSEQLRSEMNPS